MSRACQALIDLNAIRNNFAIARQRAPGARVLAVVKANAYGHGAVGVAKALSQADGYGVACIEEAVELRDAGITQPVLLLQGCFDADELEEAAARSLDIVLHCEEQLGELLASRLPCPLNVSVKIDTGMHRLGLAPERLAGVLEAATASDQVGEITLMSHFASADEPEDGFTAEQQRRFLQATADFDLPHSLANSAAILSGHGTNAHWIRPGYMLYGNTPFCNTINDNSTEDFGLQPAMKFCAEVTVVRELEAGQSVGYARSWIARRRSRIATVSAGFGDGYPRGAHNGTPVLVNGHRAELAGRVSMDMLGVDVTGLPDVTPGDPVELWGPGLSVNEVASHAGTIGYELLTRMPLRAPRIYHGA